MIRACFVIKYPPIQGGVSMASYWMARELAERGHQIFVVTNASEVEDAYRIYMDEDDREWYEPRSPATGGFVRVCPTQPSSRAMSHIPQANPFVTKLSSVATQAIRRHGCDMLFAYYLQPYGLAAHLASHWTGVPYIIRHAGSDLGRLMRQPGLTTAYREVIRAADSLWTGPTMKNTFMALGVPEERIWHGPSPRLPAIFNPAAPVLDLNALLERLSQTRTPHVQDVLINSRPIDCSKPTIGIYGKVGDVKGSFDLLQALSRLKREGLAFNFIAVTQGVALPAFKQAIQQLDLQDRTWTFPFLPHWKMPGFIRACTAVCFLEREFPIDFHAPTIPREVLASGTCLVLSGEIVGKQPHMKTQFADGENLLVVADPQDHADLARQLRTAILDPDGAARIGRMGRALYSDSFGTDDGQATASIELVEQQLEEIKAQGAARSRRPSPPDEERRKERLRVRLAWSSALLAASWHGLIDAYCQAHVVVPESPFADAVALCDFLERRLAEPTGDDGHLREVLRYEKQHNLLFMDPGDIFLAESTRLTLRSTSGRGRPASVIGKRRFMELHDRAPEEVLKLRPMTSPGVRVEVFSRDFRALARSLRDGERPLQVTDAKTIILFKKELNFVCLELKINEATKHFLDLCDGHRTVQSAIEEMGLFYQRSTDAAMAATDLTDEVMAVIRELTGKDIVHLLAEA
jgi:glycosyltransferase involved in cell wall biosynthesis